MRRTMRALIAALLRRHPDGDILQAHADRELSKLASRLTSGHVKGCSQCHEELRSSAEILGVFQVVEPASAEVLLVRERIFDAITKMSDQNQSAIGDLRLLLGRRATERLTGGASPSEVRAELAAFLGSRAADTFLARLPT
jgi:hypothetical protein